MRAATAAADGVPGDSMLWLGLPDVAVSTMDHMRGFGAEDTSLCPLGDAAGVRAEDSESDSEASDKLPPPCCSPCRGSSEECDVPLGRRRSVRSEDRESSSTSTRSAKGRANIFARLMKSYANLQAPPRLLNNGRTVA